MMLRLCVVLLLLATAACGGSNTQVPPARYDVPSYSYLTPLRLNVAQISINDAWAPHGSATHVEAQSPLSPREALARMAQDRLVAAGASGRGTFHILDASITQSGRTLEGRFSVRIDLVDEHGVRKANASATVVGSRTVSDGSNAALRSALYDFTRKLMDDMNVELEFQARKYLRDWLLSDAGTVPAAASTLPEPGHSVLTPPPEALPDYTPPSVALPAGPTSPLPPAAPSEVQQEDLGGGTRPPAQRTPFPSLSQPGPVPL